jgi:hypothetical protein
VVRKDGLPKRVEVLLDTYAHQLRREGKSEDFIVSVINGLHLDYWVAMEEELHAGQSMRRACSHAFNCLQQDLPSPTAPDPLRQSCLIDSDYVVVCLLLGVWFLSMDYFFSVDCPMPCLYDYGFWIARVSPFVTVIFIRTLRIQSCGVGTLVRNFWSFLKHLPAEFFTNSRYVYKNFALVGLCVCGTYLLGVALILTFLPVLGLILTVYVVLPTPFGCVLIGPLMPPAPMFTLMIAGLSWLIFYFASRFIDYVLQLSVGTLTRSGLTGYVLRLLRQ